jgi:hypothetical protein
VTSPVVDNRSNLDALAKLPLPVGHNGGVTVATESASVPEAKAGKRAEPKLDAVLAAAIETAREVALDAGGETVGEHVGVAPDAERVVTHEFAATVPGYQGWHWAVTLARAPRSKVVTVDDVVLLPGPEALLAPAWVPWNERLRPGDLSPGDLLPTEPDDPRLVPAYATTDDDQVDQVAYEIGLGRARVMSREGRLDAADRWFGENGPTSPMAKSAPAHCGTCGFYLALAGSLQAAFGVCGNEMAGSDGRAVSAEYGCGAHSEAVVEVPSLAELVGAVYDDGEIVPVD